jgi:hypothetical protein
MREAALESAEDNPGSREERATAARLLGLAAPPLDELLARLRTAAARTEREFALHSEWGTAYAPV